MGMDHGPIMEGFPYIPMLLKGLAPHVSTIQSQRLPFQVSNPSLDAKVVKVKVKIVSLFK